MSSINFTEYVAPDPPLYILDGSYLIKVTSPVAVSLGGGAIMMRAYVEQVGNEFTMSLTDFDEALIEGDIEGADYVATKLPASNVSMTFGTISLSTKFKSLTFTATSDYEFNGIAKITASYTGLTLTDNNVAIEAISEDAYSE